MELVINIGAPFPPAFPVRPFPPASPARPVSPSRNCKITAANSAKGSSVSNFRDYYRYLSYKYKIGNHVWDSPLCKLLKCFDSYMSHSITVFPEGSFISDLCLMRDDYSVF